MCKMKTFTILAFLAVALSTASAIRHCRGSAIYDVTFKNVMFTKRFRDVPNNVSLAFSPLLATSHSPRQSVVVLRSYASAGVEKIAEEGDNSVLKKALERLVGKGVKTVKTASGPTMLGKKTTLRVKVDCHNNLISALSMIAPSPDWFVALSNLNVLEKGRFIKRASGKLFSYDAGTDDGRRFTPPGDLSLDMPSRPKLNIVPLVEDETDRFDGKFVGLYMVKKVRQNRK